MESLTAQPALVIMARAPFPGEVKTRLMPYLSPGQCAGLYLAMLKDTLAVAAAVPEFLTYVAFTPARADGFFKRLLPVTVRLIPQQGDDLGQKMASAWRTVSAKHSPVVLVGSDTPAIQPQVLRRALEALKTKGLCIGPCRDGGYYLIGGSRFEGSIFKNVPWSTSRVFDTTIRRARAAGLSPVLLPVAVDVDVIEDVLLLKAGLDRLSDLPEEVVPHHTMAWLETNQEVLKRACPSP